MNYNENMWINSMTQIFEALCVCEAGLLEYIAASQYIVDDESCGDSDRLCISTGEIAWM